MTNTDLQKAIKFIFIPALLLSILLCCSSVLFLFSQNIIEKQLGVTQIPALSVSTILPQIILTLSLLVFAIYKPFEKVFRGTLLILIGLIALSTILMFFQKPLEPQGVSETLELHKPLETHWSISLMYIVLKTVNFSLYSLFIWGFINRLSSLSLGIKYYIPLAFILGLAGNLRSIFGLAVIGASTWSLMALMIPATVCMICSLFIFNWSWKRLPNSLIHPKETAPILRTKFPVLSAAYLLAGCIMVGNFLGITFKSQLKTQFPDSASYLKFMGYYSISVGSATILISIIWALLGTWLISKKGWRTTALYASLSILVGGIIFLSLSSSWLSQGIFKGFLTSTISSLFFPLIQILYLYLPYQNRFKAKIVTEMIALPLMKGLSSLTIQGLLIICGSIAAIGIYLKILIPVLMVLLIIASFRASARLSDTKQTPPK